MDLFIIALGILSFKKLLRTACTFYVGPNGNLETIGILVSGLSGALLLLFYKVKQLDRSSEAIRDTNTRVFN